MFRHRLVRTFSPHPPPSWNESGYVSTVVNRELVQRQVAAVADVVAAATDLDAEVWLRGGWAMDFYLGEITRDHLDIDWFVWADAMPGLVGELLHRGWTDLAEHQRDIARGDVEMGFAPLASAPDGCPAVGGGPWQGERYPEQMLAAAADGWLDGVRCRVIDPAAQVEIKQMMPVGPRKTTAFQGCDRCRPSPSISQLSPSLVASSTAADTDTCGRTWVRS